MLWWDREFLKRLDELNILVDLFTRFKDYTSIITEVIPLSTIYEKGILQHNLENQSNISECEHTARIFTKIANEVHEMITLTHDTVEAHNDMKLPILDLKVYIDEGGLIMHEFYEKETKIKNVILANSALSWAQKRTILTQEGIRRMKNTSPLLGEEVQNEHLSKFMLKLKNSGYSEKFRAEIVKSVKKAYELIVLKDITGERPMYRSRHQIEKEKKENAKIKSNWWNKNISNQNEKFSTVLFVPPTPHGELARLLKEREMALNQNRDMKIKIVESGGTKFKNMIMKSDPFPEKKCENNICPFCQNTQNTVVNSLNKFSCETANVGYTIICEKCKGTYEGETSRKAKVRALEHLKDLEKQKPSNPLVKHIKKSHPQSEGVSPKFSIKISGVFSDALTRQADEAIRIKHQKVHNSENMNSKHEFNSVPVKILKLVHTTDSENQRIKDHIVTNP